METYRRLVPQLCLAATLFVAACGGSAATAGPNVPGATTATATAAAQPPGGSATQGPEGGSATQAPDAVRTVVPGGGVAAEACSVLTAADIQALTGATLVGAVPAQQAGIQNGCLFELRDPSSATTTINLGVMTPGGRESYDSQVGAGGFPSIEGLGDAAVNFRPGNVLAVAGDVLVSVSYFGPTGPDLPITTEVARKALANLGL